QIAELGEVVQGADHDGSVGQQGANFGDLVRVSGGEEDVHAPLLAGSRSTIHQGCDRSLAELMFSVWEAPTGARLGGRVRVGRGAVCPRWGEHGGWSCARSPAREDPRAGR